MGVELNRQRLVSESLRCKAAYPSMELLRILVMIEGRRALQAKDVAHLLGVGTTSAWRFLSSLRASGVLKDVAAIRRPWHEVETIAYLRVNWTDLDGVSKVEQALRTDACVKAAVKICGEFDYRIEAEHSTVEAAEAWFLRIRQETVVSDGELHLCRTIIDRPLYGAALLSQMERQTRAE